MKTDKPIQCDLLVIGAGLAGMTAAVRAAARGLDTVVAGNPSVFAFSSGLMDYLGVYPGDSSSFLDMPHTGLDALARDLPGHAYAVTGHDKILDGFALVKETLDRAGLAYTLFSNAGSPGNRVVITAMGTLKPSFMIPATMAEGCLPVDGGNCDKTLLVAGIKGLSGFSPAQVAQGAGKYFKTARFVDVELPGVSTGMPPQILAAHLQDSEARAVFAKKLRNFGMNTDLCGIPAVFGHEKSVEYIRALSSHINMPVFEIPGAPPSVPGMRLAAAFERALARAGVRLLSNVNIKDPVFDGTRFTLTAGTGPERFKISAKGVVLATGRFFGNGLHARRQRIVETVFRLNVAQPKGRHLWHNTRFLARQGHAINRAGIETDEFFRPLDARDRPVYTHLYAAGAILAHNDWARLKSGAGASMVSACSAVDHFFASGGGYGS